MRALFALLALAFTFVADASTLYLTEFKDLPPVTFQAAPMPANANQVVTFTTGSVQSSAFTYRTILIRVQCDAVCHVNIGGSSPTATTISMRLAQDQTEYFTVHQGDKLAVIGE